MPALRCPCCQEIRACTEMLCECGECPFGPPSILAKHFAEKGKFCNDCARIIDGVFFDTRKILEEIREEKKRKRK